MRRSLALLFLPLLLPALPLAGQTPAERVAIESYRRSLPDGGSDTAGPGVQPIDELKAGFRFLDLAEDSATATNARRSLDDFYEVTVQRPRWPYGWYGLGLAKLRLDDLHIKETRSAHQPAGTGWLGGAQLAFDEALRREATFGPAIEGVAEVLRRRPEGPMAVQAMRTLDRYSRAGSLDTIAALSLARAAIRIDSVERTARYLDRYLAAGGDSAMYDWEFAALQFAEGQKAGGITLYYAAAGGGLAVIQAVRENLALIATPEELASFDACPAAGRVAWLHEFWRIREIRDGRAEGTRLPEHFRRIQYARRHFTRRSTVRPPGFNYPYRDGPVGLDDRGAIYIRQGDPDARATYVGGMGTPPNESWAYWRPSGNLVFHFSARDGPFLLVDILAAVDPGAGSALYETRASLGTEYLALAGRMELEEARSKLRLEPELIPPELRRRERLETLEAIHIGTTSDANPLAIERTWQPIAQAFGVSDPATGSSGVLVVIALPVPRDLKPVTLPDGAAGYVLNLRATAADSNGVVTLDTDSMVRVRTPRPLEAGQSLTVVKYFAVAPGAQRIRVIVSDSTESRGAVRIFPDIPVTSFGGDTLEISDLVTGREGSNVRWERGDGEILSLHPNNAWTPNDILTTAFDLGGTRPGDHYTIRFAISDIGADSTRPPRAAVQFEREATTAREFVSQSISLNALRPGRYLLTVTVTAGDRSVKRERRITVVR